MNEVPASEVNPHYLDHVMTVADSHGVEASEDIIARNGMKLLAKGARIDASVRDRLLEHKLNKPLEECMQVAAGVTGAQLQEVATQLLDDCALLRELYKPKGLRTEALQLLKHMPMGAPMQSLVTVFHGSGPDKLPHAMAVALMALGLSLRLKSPRTRTTATQFLQAGLCHDVGELYIEPSYLQREQGVQLKPEQWKHVAAHPVVGWRVLKDMPGMGKVVADLVLTHHERLDGFGYPRGLMGDALSLDHQMLALSELLGSIKSTRMAPLLRADVAVKLIPGEYERELIDVVDQTVRQCEVGELVQTLVPLPSVDDTLRKAEATASYVQRLAEARELLLVEVQTSSDTFKQLTQQAFGRFDSIQKALASTGVDTRAPQDLREHLDNQGLHLELALVLREINWRLRELEREMTVRVERSAPTELARLARVVAHIRGTQDGAAQPATADALG
ncbi:MAG: HD-GYP domain-containing protein [Pseudomonadota bacterium]